MGLLLVLEWVLVLVLDLLIGRFLFLLCGRLSSAVLPVTGYSTYLAVT